MLCPIAKPPKETGWLPFRSWHRTEMRCAVPEPVHGGVSRVGGNKSRRAHAGIRGGTGKHGQASLHHWEDRAHAEAGGSVLQRFQPGNAITARSTAAGPGTRASRGSLSSSPAFQDLKDLNSEGPSIHGESSDIGDAEPIKELLVDQLRDILELPVLQLVRAPRRFVGWTLLAHAAQRAARYPRARHE